MPELACRGQGRKQKSDGDGNLFHWELLFLSIWIYAPRRFVYPIETVKCPTSRSGSAGMAEKRSRALPVYRNQEGSNQNPASSSRTNCEPSDLSSLEPSV